MKKVIEYFEFKYTYDDKTYVKDFTDWTQMMIFRNELEFYCNDLEYTITKLGEVKLHV